MRSCMKCGADIKNNNHDYCYDCWEKLEDNEKSIKPEDNFKFSLTDKETPIVYIMFYADTRKIGFTNDLNSRIIEIKRQYPNNKLVYFREFEKESIARRFEVWLKALTDRELNKFISDFQDKIKKVELF